MKCETFLYFIMFSVDCEKFQFLYIFMAQLNLLYLQLKVYNNMLEVKVAFSTTKYIYKFEKILSYDIRINQKKILYQQVNFMNKNYSKDCLKWKAN